MERTIRITDVAYGGSGVGRMDGKVVFVPYTVPGDVVRVEITAQKKGYCEGALIEVISPSPHRTAPRCEYFTRCGACHLQQIDYAEQLRLKKKMLVDSLARIGRVEAAEFDEPEPSSETFGYRSRARFQVEGGRWGFFGAATRSVVEVDSCPLLARVIDETFGEIRGALGAGPASNSPLYGVEIAAGGRGKRVAAAFYLACGPGQGAEAALEFADALSPVKLLKGFEVRTSRRRYDYAASRAVASVGDAGVAYSAGGFDLLADISVFTQVNMGQNRRLVERVLEYADLTGPAHVLDLFCGAGNLSLPLAARASRASKAGRVTGVEGSRRAVRFARENAEAGAVANAEFIEADVAAWLEANMKTLEKQACDVVVLDPPRGGDRRVAEALSRLRPARIVYVSCSPPTLARDLSILAGAGYRLLRAGLFDMFPQTFHVECIAGLGLRP